MHRAHPGRDAELRTTESTALPMSLRKTLPRTAAPRARAESEEYLDSEKYEIRQRDRNAPGSLVPLHYNPE